MTRVRSVVAMMRLLLPAATNEQYSGSHWPPVFLGVLGLITIGPGLVHYLLPDGGAGVIAGLELGPTHSGATIVGVFAWEGATQLAFGFALLIISLRYRSLTALFLLLALIETTLQALAEWVLKPGGGSHHPPGSYCVLVTAPLAAGMLVWALRPRRPRFSDDRVAAVE